MTESPRPRAWLLLAAGNDRQFGGNSGYDDQADVYYSWDSTVNNHKALQPGDIVAVWDKRRLLGVSVIESIKPTDTNKLRFRCPNSACGKSQIKARATKSPLYRCQQCGTEFDEPLHEDVRITRYQSTHDAAWTWLEGVLSGDELRQLCVSPKSQLSMRELDWVAFERAIGLRGASSAVDRALSRALDAELAGVGRRMQLGAHGHTRAFVRVRRGQRKFRDSLIAQFGDTCALTGAAPERVLDAGHLYSYAELGVHHEFGGLLLRRDVHRLFDDGMLAVDPGSLKIDVSDALAGYPQYARLHDAPVRVELRHQHVEWLARHWVEHRLTPNRADARSPTVPLH